MNLREVLNILERSGVKPSVTYNRSGQPSSIKVSPCAGRKKRRLPNHKDSELSRDCPVSGPFAGVPLGFAVFKKNGVEACTALGYILHGHNNYLLSAQSSSVAFNLWLSALSYFCGCGDIEDFDVKYMDVTYQFKCPDIPDFSRRVGDAMRLRGKCGKKVLLDCFRGNIMGEQSRTRRWSGYDKFREVQERDGVEVDGLRGVYRITERVYARDPVFPSLMADKALFSQEGLLNVLRERWDGLQVNVGDGVNVRTLIEEFGHQRVAQALYYHADPSNRDCIIQAMTEPSDLKNFKDYYKRRILPVIERMESQKESFSIRIPEAKDFVELWDDGIYYMEGV